MESRGRRIPRMTAPADAAAPQGMPEANPIRVDKLVEEPSAPPEMIVQRISPPVPVIAARPAPAALPAVDIGRDIFDVISESRAALARGVESISDEIAGLARHSIDATAHTAIQMLGVKTWADAVAINTAFARTGFDHWLDSSAKVSELGVKLAVESSKPFVAKFGQVWSGAHSGR
jgi:hypothetical protein